MRRTLMAALCGLVLALGSVACGSDSGGSEGSSGSSSSDGSDDTTTEDDGSVDDTAPETEGEDTEEAPDNSGAEAVSVRLPGLPVGGNHSVESVHAPVRGRRLDHAARLPGGSGDQGHRSRVQPRGVLRAVLGELSRRRAAVPERRLPADGRDPVLGGGGLDRRGLRDGRRGRAVPDVGRDRLRTRPGRGLQRVQGRARVDHRPPDDRPRSPARRRERDGRGRPPTRAPPTRASTDDGQHRRRQHRRRQHRRRAAPTTAAPTTAARTTAAEAEPGGRCRVPGGDVRQVVELRQHDHRSGDAAEHA